MGRLFQQIGQRKSARLNGQKGSSAMHCGVHRAHQSTKDDLAIHWRKYSLQSWWHHTTGPRLLRMREWNCACAMTSPLKNISHRFYLWNLSVSLYFSSSMKTCSNKSVAKQGVKMITGGHSHKPACWCPLDQWSLISVPRAEEVFSSM